MITRHVRRRNGAVAVEVATVFLPIFLLAMLGILEFGRAYMVRQVVVNGAREGARQAILPGAQHSQVISSVNNYLASTTVDAPSKTIEIRDQSSNLVTDLSTVPSHDPISVTVSVPYNEVSWGVRAFFNNANLRATVTMRKE